MTDQELGELLEKFYPSGPELKVNLDTSTEEGQRWRAHVLSRPLREWQAKQSDKDLDPYFDYRG